CAAVNAALDALRDPLGKEFGSTETSIDDFVALVGHLTPADRAALGQVARAKFLDAKGERRFVILAAFAAVLPAEEAAPLVKDLAARLEKAFASLAPQSDVLLLERAVRLSAGRMTRDDAAALAAAVAKCAAR